MNIRDVDDGVYMIKRRLCHKRILLVNSKKKKKKKKQFKKTHRNLETFSKMSNLKLLIIHGVRILHGLEHLPNGLKFIYWSGSPF